MPPSLRDLFVATKGKERLERISCGRIEGSVTADSEPISSPSSISNSTPWRGRIRKCHFSGNMAISFVAINELRPRDGNFPSGVITRNFNAVNHQQGNLAAI